MTLFAHLCACSSHSYLPKNCWSKVDLWWDYPCTPGGGQVSQDGFCRALSPYEHTMVSVKRWNWFPLALHLGWLCDWLGQEFCLHSGPIQFQFCKSSFLTHISFHWNFYLLEICGFGWDWGNVFYNSLLVLLQLYSL